MALELLVAIVNEMANTNTFDIDICANEMTLNTLLMMEKNRRIKFEAPPDAEQYIMTELSGMKYKVKKDGKAWEMGNPCVICTDEECFQQLSELTGGQLYRYIYDGVVSMCKNPLNNGLLRMLCQWRQHIKDTFIIEQKPGSDKWKKMSICTSEMTFLGRKTEMNGIIGTIAATNHHICSLSSLVSLQNKEEGVHTGVKGLSIGFAILIAMYMDWDLYTDENVQITTRLLKKVRTKGKVGNDIYRGTPWYSMFKCILERRRIPDKLKEMILSRAHLP